MKIGTVKEVLDHEYRVGLTPAGVELLRGDGHSVVVESGAGNGAGFSDADYEKAGAWIAGSAAEVFDASMLLVKVKEPKERELAMLRPGHTLITYLHLAADERLTHRLRETGAACLAYETLRDRDGRLPLLAPMSEIAGALSVLDGARLLQRSAGGKGVLLASIPGVRPARVLILGGGTVGATAARVAAGSGAEVVLLDNNVARLRELSALLPANVTCLYSTPAAIREELPAADLVIGGVLLPGDRAPMLVTRPMLATMKPGSVLMDVAIDQGGCFETSRPTSHSAPTYVVDGIVHSCVPNMPGVVPATSTRALTQATLPYIRTLASAGWRAAIESSAPLREALNVADGKIYHPAIARCAGIPLAA